jgi:hypothetical protein
MMSATFVVLVVIGAAAIVRDPGAATRALSPVLLLQLFAASSGFAMPARRGHYDLLLTRGGSRLWLALAHWAASVAPGVASWILLAAAEQLASQGANLALLSSGTCAAVLLVSTLPWALTVRLPRFAGAIAWLLVLATVSSTAAAGTLEGWTIASSGIPMLARPAWVFLIYPLAAVGQDLSHAQLVAISPALVMAICGMVLACRWIDRADVPLEAAQ